MYSGHLIDDLKALVIRAEEIVAERTGRCQVEVFGAECGAPAFTFCGDCKKEMCLGMYCKPTVCCWETRCAECHVIHRRNHA